MHHLASGTGRRILFMRTKHQARKLAKQLTESGVPSVDLHGNLSQNARDRNLAAFSAGDARVLVATDIAARGVHVDEVELVVHVDPPVEHKAYLHRSGRTARAGNSGDVVTVVLPEQRRDTAGTDAQGRDQCPPAGGRARTRRRCRRWSARSPRTGLPLRALTSPRKLPRRRRAGPALVGAAASAPVPGGRNIATTAAVGAACQAEPVADVASIGCSARAAQTMSSAVRNASVPMWIDRIGSRAARRSNMTARAVLVRHGTTSRRARPRLPVTVMTR